MQRFRAYLKSHPAMTEQQKRRVIAAFLDKFAIPDAIEEDLNAPGWTEETIEAMTEIYESDMAEVASILGISVSAVKMRLSRARMRFRQFYQEEHG